LSLANIQELDDADVLAGYRSLFSLPPNTIYLDGNSLGAMPIGVTSRIKNTLEKEWSQDLILSWNTNNWIDLPLNVGEKIAPLIGASSGQVICTDTTSVNLFKLLATAMKLKPDRHEILSQIDNFPTDLYMAQGLAGMFPDNRLSVHTCTEDEISNTLSTDTLVLMLTHTNFRTGKIHDMKALTRLAHEKGALVIWDLSHSTGAMPIHLDACGVDMAVGCGYKYLNGGPGAPAFLYLTRSLQNKVSQPLSGWMGHEKPFDFNPLYDPGKGMRQYLCGTPSVLAMAGLDAALDIFATVDLQQIQSKSQQLGDLFISLVSQAHLDLNLISPTDGRLRGSQVSFTHPEGYSIMQALIAKGVIGDFREPDIMRFGFAPLYIRYADVEAAVTTMKNVIEEKAYFAPQYQMKNQVT